MCVCVCVCLCVCVCVCVCVCCVCVCVCVRIFLTVILIYENNLTNTASPYNLFSFPKLDFALDSITIFRTMTKITKFA